MNSIGVTAIVIGCFLILYLFKNKKKKPNKNNKKSWVILEHEEGEDEKTTKCYRAEHKETKRASPCFKQINNLNEWIKQNGTKQTA